MRFDSVLVVCLGNICRSPLGERLLQRACGSGSGAPVIRSAGLRALEGHPADPVTREVADAHGLSLEGHRARSFTTELGAAHDLILVMEPWHRAEIDRQAPQLSGRTLLFDKWSENAGIADPYRQSRAVHERVFDLIDRAAHEWASRIAHGAG